MTTTITPVAQYPSANPTRTQDGEDAYMDGGPAPLGNTLQTAFDRNYFNWQFTHFGLRLGGPVQLSASGVTLPAFVVSLFDGTAWKAYSYTPAGAVALSGLSANSWYYLYGIVSAGALALQYVTTVPDSSLVWKDSTFGTHRYLGTFRSGPSGDPLSMINVKGRCLYRRGAITTATDEISAGGLRKTINTTNGSYADLDLSSCIPPHARIAILLVEVTGSASARGTLNLNTDPDTGSTLEISAETAERNTAMVEVEVSASQVIQYLVSCASGNPTVVIDVLGWLE